MPRSLNYKHLHYFWAVARWGGITRAAERLHLTPQTLSGQIKQLEESIGVALYPTHASDASALLRAADAAMYQAKRAGVGTWHVAESPKE